MQYQILLLLGFLFNSGDSVPTDEQVTSKDQHRQSGVFDNSAMIGSPASSGSPVTPSLSNDERKKFDDERVKLFVQLDEKVSFTWRINDARYSS